MKDAQAMENGRNAQLNDYLEDESDLVLARIEYELEDYKTEICSFLKEIENLYPKVDCRKMVKEYLEI